MEISKSMLLFTSAWGPQGEEKPTFRMLPLNTDCPYLECIFDPARKILAVISKIEKKSYTMIPRLNDNGDVMMLKGKETRPGGQHYKEERRQIESYQEFYIEEATEIRSFINMFAYNMDLNWSAKIDQLMLKTPEKGPGPGKVTLADPKQITLEEGIAATGQPMTIVAKD